MKKLFLFFCAGLFIFLSACSDISNDNSIEKAVILQNLFSQSDSEQEEIDFALNFQTAILPTGFEDNDEDFSSVAWNLNFTVSDSNNYKDARDFSVSNRLASSTSKGDRDDYATSLVQIKSVKKGIYDLEIKGKKGSNTYYGFANAVDFSSLSGSLPISMLKAPVDGKGTLELTVNFDENSGWSYDNLSEKFVNVQLIPVTPKTKSSTYGITSSDVVGDSFSVTLSDREVPSGYYTLQLNLYTEDDSTLIPIITSPCVLCISNGLTTEASIDAYYSVPLTELSSTYYAKDDSSAIGSGLYTFSPIYIWDLLELLLENVENGSKIYIYCDDFLLDVEKWSNLLNTTEVTYRVTQGSLEGAAYLYFIGRNSKFTISINGEASFEITDSIMLTNSGESKRDITTSINNDATVHFKDTQSPVVLYFVNRLLYNLYTIFYDPDDYVGYTPIKQDTGLTFKDPVICLYDTEKESVYRTENYYLNKTSDGYIDSYTLKANGAVKFDEVEVLLRGCYSTDKNVTYESCEETPLIDDTFIIEPVIEDFDANTATFEWKLDGSIVSKKDYFSFNPVTYGMNEYSNYVVECVITLTSECVCSQVFELNFSGDVEAADLDSVLLYREDKDSSSSLKLYNPNGENYTLLTNISNFWIPGDDYIYVSQNSKLYRYILYTDNRLSKNYDFSDTGLSSVFDVKMAGGTIYILGYDDTSHKQIYKIDSENQLESLNLDTSEHSNFGKSFGVCEEDDQITILTYWNSYFRAYSYTENGCTLKSYEEYSIADDPKVDFTCYNGKFYASFSLSREYSGNIILMRGTLLEINVDENFEIEVNDLFSNWNTANPVTNWYGKMDTIFNWYLPSGSRTDEPLVTYLYNPQKILAIRDDELIILDLGFYLTEDDNYGDMHNANRFVNFNLSTGKIKSTTMTKGVSFDTSCFTSTIPWNIVD